jgi:hypothetical protein
LLGRAYFFTRNGYARFFLPLRHALGSQERTEGVYRNAHNGRNDVDASNSIVAPHFPLRPLRA